MICRVQRLRILRNTESDEAFCQAVVTLLFKTSTFSSSHGPTSAHGCYQRLGFVWKPLDSLRGTTDDGLDVDNASNAPGLGALQSESLTPSTSTLTSNLALQESRPNVFKSNTTQRNV
jgi:hypothetical protein